MKYAYHFGQFFGVLFRHLSENSPISENASKGGDHNLYHFTDSRNLQSIKDTGALYSTARLRQKGIKSFYPGGNDLSLDLDKRFGMDQFVHLCFNLNHPLAYLAKQRGSIQKIAWLTIDLAVLNRNGVMFCPGVSNRTDMPRLPVADRSSLDQFRKLHSSSWDKCEILVPDSIPFELISNGFPNV
jgi:hypothetical protein